MKVADGMIGPSVHIPGIYLRPRKSILMRWRSGSTEFPDSLPLKTSALAPAGRLLNSFRPL